MRLPRPAFLAVAALALVLATSGSSLAAYDMSGKWLLVGVNQRLDITQTDGSLTSPIPAVTGGFHGTVDEGTGAFELTSYGSSPTHSAIVIAGTVSPDGKTFDATYSYSYVVGGTPTTIHIEYVSIPVTGSRCGNQQIDFDENCDDGNAAGGDCCSATCTLDAMGAACTDDQAPCTIDACDGAGVCEHEPTTGACSDLHGCGTGTCESGECVISSPAPAGTSCDLDSSACTLDQCDGSGACDAGATLDCSPCGLCRPDTGCVIDDPEPNFLLTCDDSPDAVSLSIRVDPDSERHRLAMMVKEGVYPGDADSSYKICLFRNDGTEWPPLYSATVPAGGTCNGSDCWKQTNQGFAYKDRSLTAGGLSNFSLHQRKGIRFKGRGPNLRLPVELPSTESSLLYRITRHSGGYDNGCWRQQLTTQQSTSTKYKGKY